MSSRPTISTTNAWRVGMSMAFRQPRRNAMTSTCQTCTVFDNTSADMTSPRIIAKAWVATSVRRFGRESAINPPNRPSTSTGANCTAATTPRSNGSPVSWRTSQLWATVIIHVPTSEMSWPP